MGNELARFKENSANPVFRPEQSVAPSWQCADEQLLAQNLKWAVRVTLRTEHFFKSGLLVCEVGSSKWPSEATGNPEQRSLSHWVGVLLILSYQLILEDLAPSCDACFSLLQDGNWKGFRNLAASAQQDNGIKEAGKGIVSVKENVGFVAVGKRRIKDMAYVSVACCTQLLLIESPTTCWKPWVPEEQ